MIVTLNFEVPTNVRDDYGAIAKRRKVPVQNLYAAVLGEALCLDLVATVACEGRKPRAKETKPRPSRAKRAPPAEVPNA